MSTTVDVHAHVVDLGAVATMHRLRPELAPQAVSEPDGVHLRWASGMHRGPLPAGMHDLPTRLRDMDRQGVDLHVLSVPPFLFHDDLEVADSVLMNQVQNDALLETAAAAPERIAVLATLPLGDAEAAVREAERIAASPAVRGVEIPSNVRGANLDDPGLEPVWSALEALDLAVLVHPGAGRVAGAERLKRYYLANLIGNPVDSTIAVASLIFGGVLERHPRLRFCFVHAGGFVPYQIGRWRHGWQQRSETNAILETDPAEALRSIYTDSLTLDRLSLEFLGARMGWDRVLLGSDYPFDMAEPDPVGRIAELDLAAAERALVLGGNAEAFLRPTRR